MNEWNTLFNNRLPYVFFLVIINLPFALKRELTEIKLTQVLLFFGATFLVVLLITNFVQHNDIHNLEISKTQLEFSSIKSISCLMLSYTCQLNVLPISNLLKNKTTESYKKTCQLAIGLSTIFYLIIAVLGIYIFGTVINAEFDLKVVPI